MWYQAFSALIFFHRLLLRIDTDSWSICMLKNYNLRQNMVNMLQQAYWHLDIFGQVFNIFANDYISPYRWNGIIVIWWHHQMEIFSTLLTICVGNSPVTHEFPSQKPVKQSVDVSFDLHPNKWLGKQLRHQWFEKPSCSLWRHCNDFDEIVICDCTGSCQFENEKFQCRKWWKFYQNYDMSISVINCWNNWCFY